MLDLASLAFQTDATRVVTLMLAEMLSAILAELSNIWDLPPRRQVWFDGAVAGLNIGLLSLGIVLTYRSSRVINFAVGNMGLPGATLFALLVINWGWPFWPALARRSRWAPDPRAGACPPGA